jgi:hypothetical protein
MRMRHAMMLTLVGAVAAACDTRPDTDTEPGLLPGDDATVTDAPRDMLVARGEFQPTAEAGALNISGWAELRQRGTTMDDGLELRAHLMGLSEGDHAWHIHSGTCESPGPIVLPLSDVPEGMQVGAADTRAQPGATQDPGTMRTTTDRSGISSDLNAGSDGMVEETVNIDGDWARAIHGHRDLVVAVHLRGGDNPGPAIACAPIQMTGMGTQPGMGTQQPGTTPSY